MSNLEDDHVAGKYGERQNYHASLADLEAAVRSFAANAGTLITCADSEALEQLLHDHPGRLSYGLAEGADYRATDMQPPAPGSEALPHSPHTQPAQGSSAR